MVNIHCTTLALGYGYQGLVETVDICHAEFNDSIASAEHYTLGTEKQTVEGIGKFRLHSRACTD